VKTVYAILAILWTAPAALQAQGVGQGQIKPSMKNPQALVLILQPYGFEPASVTIANRAVQVSVHNRTGKKEIDLDLIRVAGPQGQAIAASKVQTTKVDKRRLQWREYFELTPGRYVITEASEPRWRCEITVNP
jgi:hypothetical protein